MNKRNCIVLFTGVVLTAQLAGQAGAATKATTTKKAAKKAGAKSSLITPTTTKKATPAPTATAPPTTTAKSTGEPVGPPANFDRNATIRIASSTAPQNLNPHQEPNRAQRQYTFGIFDRLIGTGTDDDPAELTPMLATSWDFSSDAKTLTLKLRSDVKFHDGTPFDAKAAKANIEDAKSKSASAFVQNALASVTSVEAPDAVTLVLRTSAPASDLPSVLATGAGAMISPKALAEPSRNLSLSPGDAGSGPYLVDQMQPNVKITFNRAPSYWSPSTAGFAKRLEYTWVTEGSTKVAGLQSGQFDLIHLVTSQLGFEQDLVKSGFVSHSVASWVVQALYLRANHPPFGDQRVREAVARSIDKQAIANDLFGCPNCQGRNPIGNCTVTSQIFPKGMWAFDSTYSSPFTYDPVRAKQLFAEAGVPNLKFQFLTGAGGSYEQVAIVHQAMLKEIGVDAAVRSVSNAEYQNVYSRNEADSLYSTLPLEPDPAGQVRAILALGLGDPATEKQVIELADQALSLAKKADRAVVYRQINKLIADKALVIPVCQGRQAWVGTTKVTNVDSMPFIQGASPDISRLAMLK